MDRRGFLGRVIGVIAGSQVPWVAREFDPDFDLMESIGKVKKPSLSTLRTAIRLMDGTLLEGPGMKTVEDMPDRETDRYGFVNKVYTFQPIEVRETMIVKGAVLMSPRGTVYRENDFAFPQHLFNGDTLKVTFSVGLEGDFKNQQDRDYLG